jgi:hypothetical protein
MVVTSGIERAIQYFHAVRVYLMERKSPYQAIVAFSGEHEYGGATIPKRTKRLPYQRHGHEPRVFDLPRELYRIFGVDLTNVPGISSMTAQTILCEVGTDVSRFRNASAFASWLGLCPEKKISGGKVLFTKSRRVRSRVAIALRLAARSLHHAKTTWESSFAESAVSSASLRP